MSALGVSLRRLANIRVPMMRTMVTVTRVPVTGAMWSAQGVTRPAVMVSPSPLKEQVRCYSGADPLNMQFIHDRYISQLVLPPVLTFGIVQSNAGPESL